MDELLIRLLDAPRSPARDEPVRGASRIEEGAKVEARYRGRSKYYPGVISRDHRDGTFDRERPIRRCIS